MVEHTARNSPSLSLSPLHLKTCYTISIFNGAAETRERERLTETKVVRDTESTRALSLFGSKASKQWFVAAWPSKEALTLFLSSPPQDLLYSIWI